MRPLSATHTTLPHQQPLAPLTKLATPLAWGGRLAGVAFFYTYFPPAI